MKNYYQVLKIYPSASQALILEAYKSRMKELADGSPGYTEEELEQLVQEVKEAFEVLNEPARRAQYDRLLLEQYMFGGTRTAELPTILGAPPVKPSPVPEVKKDTKESKETIYERIRKEQPERIRDVEAYLGRNLTETRGMLNNHSAAPEPVQAPSLEEISPDEAMALASSRLLDGAYEDALKILNTLEKRCEGDKNYPKILLRLGEMYNRFLKVPEKAVGYYRKLMDFYQDSPEALVAEKRLEALESLGEKKKVSFPAGEIIEDMGEVWKVRCPHCQADLIVPSRKDIWFICPKCGEKFVGGENR